MIKVQIIHRTGRKTNLVAEEIPESPKNIYIFKIGEGHYVNVPIDSIEVVTIKYQPDD